MVHHTLIVPQGLVNALHNRLAQTEFVGIHNLFTVEMSVPGTAPATHLACSGNMSDEEWVVLNDELPPPFKKENIVGSVSELPFAMFSRVNLKIINPSI